MTSFFFNLHNYLDSTLIWHLRVHRKLSSSNFPGSLFGFNTGIRSHSRSDESSFFFKGVLIPHAWYGGICCLTSPKGLFLSTLKTGETMWAEFWSGFSLCWCHRVDITEIASRWLCSFKILEFECWPIVTKVIIEQSRGEVEEDTIENVSWPIIFFLTSFYATFQCGRYNFF